MTPPTTIIHATAILCGPRALLIRGPSGSGKSRLAMDIIAAAPGFARLVADDRVMLTAAHGRLLAAPMAGAGGLIEIRGLGIARLAHEPLARVALLADLVDPPAAPRLAEPGNESLLGIDVPMLAVARGAASAARICLAAMAHLNAGGGLGDFSEPPARQ